MLSVLRLILTVSLVRAFINVSISNINEHVEIFFFCVTDDLWNKGVSRMRSVCDSLSCQLFFTRKAPNEGRWGSSEYLGIVGLKGVLMLDIEPTALRLNINRNSERVNLKPSIPSLAAQ